MVNWYMHARCIGDLMKLAAALVLTIVLPISVSSAATVYSYSGNAFSLFSDSTPPLGMYDTSMRVTGKFIVADPLPEMAFGDIRSLVSYAEFSDGRNTLSTLELPETSYTLNFEVNSTGEITRWVVEFQQAWSRPSFVGEVREVIQTQGGRDFLSYDWGEISICTEVSTGTTGSCVISTADRDWGLLRSGGGLTAGEWSVSTVVPVPASAWLFGSALWLLGWLRRKPA